MAWIEIPQEGVKFEQSKLPRRKDIVTVGKSVSQLKKKYGKGYKKHLVKFKADYKEHMIAFRRNLDK